MTLGNGGRQCRAVPMPIFAEMTLENGGRQCRAVPSGEITTEMEPRLKGSEGASSIVVIATQRDQQTHHIRACGLEPLQQSPAAISIHTARPRSQRSAKANISRQILKVCSEGREGGTAADSLVSRIRSNRVIDEQIGRGCKRKKHGPQTKRNGLQRKEKEEVTEKELNEPGGLQHAKMKLIQIT
eukprot:1156831-Pelagomonas_calceolata.AAC.2